MRPRPFSTQAADRLVQPVGLSKVRPARIMKLFLEGDKSKAICDRCAGVVQTTFERRDVPFSNGSGIAKNILVGVCTVCDDVVAIPAQSTPAISRAGKERPLVVTQVQPVGLWFIQQAPPRKIR